jgi:tetratricopeptide (TPR) repeat protein
LLKVVNELRQNPPAKLGIAVQEPVRWEQVFGSKFPRPLDTPGDRLHPAALDSGGSELGLALHRHSILPYEELLLSELADGEVVYDTSKQRQILEKLSSLYESLGEWGTAVRCLKRLREVNRKFLDHGYVADSSLRLGVALYRLGSWDESGRAVEEGLSVVEQHRSTLGGSRTELRLCGYRALVRLRKGDPAGALQIMDEQVQPLAVRHESMYVHGTFHHRRAIIQLEMPGRREASHADFKAAIRYRLDCGAVSEVSRTVYFLGEWHHKHATSRRAVELWQLCLRRHRAYKDVLGLARAFLAIGRTYRDWLRDGAEAPGTKVMLPTIGVIDGEEAALIRRLHESSPAQLDDDLEEGLTAVTLRHAAITKLERARTYAVRANDQRLVIKATEALEVVREHHHGNKPRQRGAPKPDSAD